ncbi:MAG: Formyltetrahydrofolate deformylase, partial [uncultured Blastococcus sp.]
GGPWSARSARHRRGTARRPLPRPARHRARDQRSDGRARRQHHRLPAALLGSQRRHVHPAPGVRPRPARRAPARARAAARGARGGVAVGLAADRGRPPAHDRGVRQQDRPRAPGADLPGAGRRPARPDRLRGLQPPRPGAGGSCRGHPVPPRAGDAGVEGRRRGAGAGAGRRRRPGGPGAVHADRLGGLLRPLPGAADQHPPQLPAGVRRREPLPGRPRPRGEAHRRDRPLRDAGAGRRADHRAGGRPGGPPGDGGGHAPGGALRRAAGPRAGGDLARGGPRHRRGPPHHRLRV